MLTQVRFTFAGLLLVLAVVFVWVALAFVSTSKGQVYVEPQRVELTAGTVVQLALKRESSTWLSGTKVVDLTRSGHWYSEQEDIFSLSNAAEITGQLMAHAAGEGIAYVEFGSNTYEIPVTVTHPSLKVSCLAGVESAPAEVGDEIAWIGIYEEIGLPPYQHEWLIGDEVVSEEAVYLTTYETVGLKQVSFRVSDQLENVAETECTLEVVEATETAFELEL